MIGKIYKWKGQTISKKTDDYQIGIRVLDPRDYDSSDEVVNLSGSHGVRTSPTYARGRKIAIEGIILGDTRAQISMGMDYLDSIFSLQSTFFETEFFEFLFTDEQDRNWTIQAKIKEPLKYKIEDDDFIEGTPRFFRVVLLAEDPRYFGDIESITTGIESIIGGVQLGVELPVALYSRLNEITINTTGNQATPLKITISCTNSIETPIFIRNETLGFFCGFNINCSPGDVIVIDSKTKTATKNGINILANRITGSSWLIAKGENILTAYDIDGGLLGSDFNIEISFKNILL